MPGDLVKILIDTDPFVYRIAWAAQPNCYWVNNIPFDTKAEAVNYCCRHEFDIASIEKEQFLFSPRYVKQFVKAQLRPVVNNCATALEEKEDAEVEVSQVCEWHVIDNGEYSHLRGAGKASRGHP